MSGQQRHATTTTIVVQAQDGPEAGFQASLVGLSGSVFGSRFLVGQDTVVLGRDPETCDIFVDDSGVSRMHAKIVHDRRGHRLVDCGSKNGTLVDEQPVTDVLLTDGQQIRVGKSVFKYLRLNAVEMRYHDRMARLSHSDELTGIGNRRRAWEAMKNELARSDRHQHDLTIILFDLDHFKAVNDTFGHTAGDECLIEVTRRVSAMIRAEDTFARIGGEEFLIVLPEVDIVEGAEIATRVRDVVGATPITAQDEQIPVTVSLGVTDLAELHSAISEKLDDGAAVEAFVGMADAKLYEAKHLGRNRVAV